MKKQFFRVKQLADQTFSRSGKTEALTDELQAADRKVEQLRVALQALCKRLGPTGGGVAQSQDPAAREKRLRKLPEYMLGLSMYEASNFDDDSILKYIMQECAKTEIALANEIAEHEIKVEQLVLGPLNSVAEQDLPGILKAKKQLSRLTNEKDSAANRYQYLIRTGDTGGSSVIGGGSAASAVGTKLCVARDELDEAASKAEQARDVLAADMFALLARETELANTILQYVKLQRAYHESALHALSEIVPDLEKFINDSSIKPMFGYPLEEHLRVTGRTIAYPIELCVCALHELGLGEEGLFRIAGSISRVRRMKLSLDAGIFTVPLPTEYRDVHVIAAVLKSYLRELPEPLVPRAIHSDILTTAGRGGGAALKDVLNKLPPTRYANLRYLVKFLAALTKNQSVNKMTPFNLAVVIAPNLLWFDMTTTAAVNHAVELLITDADYYFGEDFSFFTSFTKEDIFPDLCEYGFSPAFIQGPPNSTTVDQTNGDHNMRPPYGDHHMTKSFHEYSVPNTSKNLMPYSQGRHSRSNSNDTSLILVDENIKRAQSNSSLSDQSSPPHGSPKPVLRRKNKPIAPVPPNFTPPDKGQVRTENVESKIDQNFPKDKNVTNSVAEAENKPDKPPRPVGPDVGKVVSGVQTINRSTYKNKHGTKTNANITGSKENLAEPRRKSLDFEQEEGISALSKPPIVPVTISQSIINQPVQVTKTKPAPGETVQNSTQTVNKNSVSTKSGFLPTKQHVTVQNRPAPVAAPRTTITQNNTTNKFDSLSFIDSESSTEVQLRQKPVPPEIIAPKPVVPERPPALRPQSFRNSIHKISAIEMLVDNNQLPSNTISPTTPTVLERTNVYTIDKQQPMLINVSSVTKSEDESPEENKSSIQRTHSTGSSNQKAEKNDVSSDEPKSFSSQTRKLSQSEGNILDVPPSPRNIRPPRPQGPAPPPPITPALVIPAAPAVPQNTSPAVATVPAVPTPAPRPKSDSAESTDL